MAECFGCDGGEQNDIHKTRSGAIEAAWQFVHETIDSDVDEDELRKELAAEGTWVHEGDEGEDLVVDLCKTTASTLADETFCWRVWCCEWSREQRRPWHHTRTCPAHSKIASAAAEPRIERPHNT